jgi:hypothetical protein
MKEKACGSEQHLVARKKEGNGKQQRNEKRLVLLQRKGKGKSQKKVCFKIYCFWIAEL